MRRRSVLALLAGAVMSPPTQPRRRVSRLKSFASPCFNLLGQARAIAHS